jgi:membrane peptidoglycan carboxypeptidase
MPVQFESAATRKRGVLHRLVLPASGLLIAASLAGLAGFATVAVYSAVVVYSARQYTLTTILPSLSQARSEHYPLTVADLSPKQLDMLLKVEDPQFFTHGGVDFSTPGAGITTITQSLVKHLYFEKFSPGFAKLKQTLIAAYALDPLMPKQEQLRLFINMAYFEANLRGFEPAAQRFFGKPFSQLSEDEFTAIVAMLIAPEVFHVKTAPARNQERVARIKKLARGDYQPRGLFDLYYGKLDAAAQAQVPSFTYFERYYR